MINTYFRSANRLLAPLALVALVALTALSGCAGSATEPGHDDSRLDPVPLPRRVEIGDTVVEKLVPGSDTLPNVHTFATDSAGWASLLIDVDQGGIIITVIDSATGRFLHRGTFVANSSPSPVSMSPFPVEPGHVYTVSVYTVTVDSVAFSYTPFRVNTAPESSPSRIAIGAVVSSETLDRLADIDEFTFEGKAGDEIIVYAQGLDTAGAPGRLSVRVTLPDTMKLSRLAIAAPGDPDPESHTTRSITLPADGVYSVSVTSYSDRWYDQPPMYVGPYRIEVARIDRAPETQPSTIAPGDTVDGAIEHVGDVDEFHIDALAGERFNVFFEASDGTESNALRLELPLLPGADSYAIQTRGSDEIALTENPTGTFRVAADGPFTLRVRGQSDGDDLNRGGYRLFAYPIDSLPEAAEATTLSLGDTVGDQIDLPGDIDEFPVVIPTTSLLNIELWRGAPSRAQAPTVRLIDANGSVVMGQYLSPNDQQEWAWGTGAVAVPAGSYTLRVLDEWTRSTAYRGPWRVMLHQVDSLPESHTQPLVPGDTVEEMSDPMGDVDHFEMAVRRGEHYDIYVQPSIPLHVIGRLETAPLYHTDFELYAPPPGGATLLESPHSNRVDILQDGVFVVRVEQGMRGVDPADHGPYRMVVTRFSGGLEHHAATIALGDTIDDEALDYQGDLDEFTLAGAPGGEATILFAASSTTQGIVAQLFDLDTKEVVREMRSYVARQGTGRFRLPASGRIGVRFMESPMVGGYGLVGPYSVYVEPVSRTPESAAATFSIGDIVSGESIEFSGDVDEFTFAAEAGESLRAFLDLPHGDWGGYLGLTLEVSPSGSDSVLGSVSLMNPAPDLDVGTGVITIPASGSYTVRVHASDERSGGTVPTEYRFQLRREP